MNGMEGGTRGGTRPFGMRERLLALDREIPVAIIGAGAMGQGLLYQCTVTPAFRCVALVDIRLERALACAEALGVPYRVVEDEAGLEEAVRAGRMAVCEDATLPARAPSVHVFIDASNAILEAGRFCSEALEHGKHLVMMNAEADLAFGPYFLQQAEARGVTYASCDGDQHGVIKRLVDDLTLWGFELVMAGNIKGFLNRYADPTSIIPEADKRNLDYRMCTAYTDGTKLCIEMALLANALGLKTAVPGMYGPRAAHVREVPDLFDLEALRNEHGAVVDYVLGAEPNGGVFAVGYCDHPYQRRMMAYYKMGPGPYYVFYRPYHLCHVEAMDAIAAAYLDGRCLLQPRAGFRTDVYAYAKRDLQAGEVLDGIGGYTCYGLIENVAEQAAAPGLPMCLAEDVTLKRPVRKDEKILLADVAYDASRLDFDLYHRAQAAAETRAAPTSG
ncbi:MAG: NAD(P)-dependent oxidoreductase [Rhodothermaceae bacterium]|nr:MAG: NAD(P)-dependent oxidoreductase [Rhodothermaceae bacterium]